MAEIFKSIAKMFIMFGGGRKVAGGPVSSLCLISGSVDVASAFYI